MHVAEAERHMANSNIQPHGPSLESYSIQPAQTSTQQQAVPEAPQEEVEVDQETADRYLLWLSTASEEEIMAFTRAGGWQSVQRGRQRGSQRFGGVQRGSVRFGGGQRVPGQANVTGGQRFPGQANMPPRG